ncbi:pentatricopeptide repeat-containing protein 5, mitochondrial [Ceratobasidium sp. AG-Ba]|nr:pentatricopeptide repeat-containing protein 5, mitochondrial [Ceratobasidium sp. AG-Ba]
MKTRLIIYPSILSGLRRRVLATTTTACPTANAYARVASRGQSIDSTSSAAPKHPPSYALYGKNSETSQKFTGDPKIPQDSKHSQAGPLRENHVAIRVKELCATGQLEQAIDYCNNVPTAVQGPVAWNTIIQAALDAKRYNFAYTQFLTMKKRAIKPTISTYLTLLKGYAQADPVNLTHIQLQRAEKLYKDWSDLMLSGNVKLNRQTARLHPAATYIEVLTNAGAHQKVWDVFYDGAATLLWRQVLRAVEKQPFPIDSHLVTAALRALRHGSEADHTLAFAIIRDYLGLEPSHSITVVGSASPNLILKLDHRALNAALDLLSYYASSANARQAYETIDWMLKEAALPNGIQVKPTSSSWALAFQACANARNWDVAQALLDRLTLTRNEEGGAKYEAILSAEAAYFALRTAYVSQRTNLQNYNQRLRVAFTVVEYVSRLWTKELHDPKHLAAVDTRGQRRLVFQNKLVELVEKIISEFGNREWIMLYRRIAQMRVDLPDEVMRRHSIDN